ncbi:MAG: hypothetical protein ACRCSB_03005 [Bacteroidales bacterium]
MFKIFTKNPITSLLFSLFLSGGLWWQSFLAPNQPKDNVPMMPLESWIMTWFEQHSLSSVCIAFAGIYVLAIILILVGRTYSFTDQNAYVAPFIFVLICSTFPIQQNMSGVYVSVLFFMMALFQLFRVYHNRLIFSSLFLAGVYLSISTLFSVNAIFLLMILIISLLLFRMPIRWRDWVITLSGIMLPYVYVVSYYWFMKQEEFYVFGEMYNCLIATSDWIFENGSQAQWLYLGYLMFLLTLAILLHTRGLLSSRIKVKKIHTLFVWSFFIMLGVMIGMPSGSLFLMPLMAVPSSVLIANYFVQTKYRLLSSMLFVLFILITYFVHYYDELSKVLF